MEIIDFSCLIGIVKHSKDGVLKDISRHNISLDKFKTLCHKFDLPINNSNKEEWYAAAAEYFKIVKEVEVEMTYAEALLCLDKTEIFKGFCAKGSKNGNIMVYYQVNDKLSISLGELSLINHKNLLSILTSKTDTAHIPKRWAELVSPYAKALKINMKNPDSVIEAIWKDCFTPILDMEFKEIDFSALPALLQGFGEGTEYTIPFTKKESTLKDLHPILSNFLRHMIDHKYFCAILIGRLIGHKQAYIPWIYGRGGDGKSTFTKFLECIVPNGIANPTLGDSFGLYESIGKTFLIFNDTYKKNLIHYPEIKNISGGDSIPIAGKHKQGKSITLPGLVIITSNFEPAVGADPAIRRRTKVFTMESRSEENMKDDIDIPSAVKLMSESVNPFLNYCLQCLEEVGELHTGKIRQHPSNKYALECKTSEELEFSDFMGVNRLVYNEKLSIQGRTLRALLQIFKQNSEYFTSNFIEYSKKNHKVSMDINGEQYIGIGKEIIKQSQDIDRLAIAKEAIGEKNVN